MTKRVPGRFGAAGPVKRIPVEQADDIAVPNDPLDGFALQYQAYCLARRKAGRRALTPDNWLKSLRKAAASSHKASWQHPPKPDAAPQKRASKRPKSKRPHKPVKAAAQPRNDYQKRLQSAHFGPFPGSK